MGTWKIQLKIKVTFISFKDDNNDITFTVPIEKEVTRINKNGEEVTENISYISQLIDSASFIATSLSNIVNNLSEEIQKIKYKYWHDDKKCETCGTAYEVSDCFLEYTNFKDDLIE